MDYITVGEIIKAQGIRGELKVKTLTASAERFKKLRILYIDEKPFRVLGLRTENPFAYIRLQGIEDRNAAEALRGKFLQIDRVNAVDLDEGEYFIADLIGCDVCTEDGTVLGRITDISQSSGTADVISAACAGGKELRFPFLNRVVRSVDVPHKKFVVIREKLDEVCVYDD